MGPGCHLTGGRPISAVGDSTVDNGTGGDDGGVGGETITPPDTTDPGATGPDGLALASVAAVTLLAATGSDLLVPGLTLALLLVAAGVTFLTRSRTVRSRVIRPERRRLPNQATPLHPALIEGAEGDNVGWSAIGAFIIAAGASTVLAPIAILGIVPALFILGLPTAIDTFF